MKISYIQFSFGAKYIRRGLGLGCWSPLHRWDFKLCTKHVKSNFVATRIWHMLINFPFYLVMTIWHQKQFTWCMPSFYFQATSSSLTFQFIFNTKTVCAVFSIMFKSTNANKKWLSQWDLMLTTITRVTKLRAFPPFATFNILVTITNRSFATRTFWHSPSLH